MASLRKPHDVPGTILAAVFVALGAFLILQTDSMSPMGSVFPITVSVAMIVFALALILRNVVLGMRAVPATAPAEAQPEASHESMPRRLLFLLAMIVWIVLIPVLGFFVSSVLAYFAIMLVATHDRMSLREGATLVVIGLAILTVFYLVMARVLLIPMPTGLFL
ncbi:MAG: tripartite tricarboxylate transporter TctB family protein [Aurantimonas endophytica]|uniref:tripartite tricarboxylate transporter TctB family protein n=1 Tax=Aurantimonas endophytica TaxID=1522175 RepID=UPI003003612A